MSALVLFDSSLQIDVQSRNYDSSNVDELATVHLRGSSTEVAAAEAGITAKVTIFLEQEARFRGNGGYGGGGSSSSSSNATAAGAPVPLNGTASLTSGATLGHPHQTEARMPGLVGHTNLNGSAAALAAGNNGASASPPVFSVVSSRGPESGTADNGMELG